MCNLVLISTDSDQDLGQVGAGLFHLRRPTQDDLSKFAEFLHYPQKWYLSGRHGGCSCHFRHLIAGQDVWFGPVEDWFTDEEDVESTAAVYDALETLVRQGAKVDLIDMWEGTIEAPKDVEVRFSEVSRADFRFWEGHRFELMH